MDEFTELALDEPGGELLAAMAYLAALAYPESIASRDRAIAAMQAWAVRLARRHGRELPAPALPVQQQHGTLRRLSRRLDKRLDAADAARDFALGTRWAGRRRPLHPEDMASNRRALQALGASMALAATLTPTHRTEPGDVLSVNAWAQQWAREKAQRDFGGRPSRQAIKPRGDFERDTWRTSRPVLHLALALLAQVESRRDLRSLPAMLTRPEWVRDALPSAERWVPLLDAATHPALSRKRTRVRLIPA